ncbi:MAG: hypothetical protein JWP07_2920 [Pseudonocardiales bacterium]|nr:hypothetical protein [Pseudonocardiales bacterium]
MTAPPLHPVNMFHVGIVVTDIQCAIADMQRIGVLAWTPVGQADSVRRVGDTSEPISVLWAFSVGPGAHVEIIQPRIAPASMTPGIHHVGYWSSDLARDSELLLAASYVSEFALGYSSDDAPHIRFFTSVSGPRIELVSESLRPGLEDAWAQARRSHAEPGVA